MVQICGSRISAEGTPLGLAAKSGSAEIVQV
jgi:hypothetical protein